MTGNKNIHTCKSCAHMLMCDACILIIIDVKASIHVYKMGGKQN